MGKNHTVRISTHSDWSAKQVQHAYDAMRAERDAALAELDDVRRAWQVQTADFSDWKNDTAMALGLPATYVADDIPVAARAALARAEKAEARLDEWLAMPWSEEEDRSLSERLQAQLKDAEAVIEAAEDVLLAEGTGAELAVFVAYRNKYPRQEAKP